MDIERLQTYRVNWSSEDKRDYFRGFRRQNRLGVLLDPSSYYDEKVVYTPVVLVLTNHIMIIE